MFKSKYIFETKKTKATRYLKNSIFFFLGAVFLYIILCLVFIRISDNQKKLTEKALFNNPPDLIVVFTGDAGRIPQALKKAKEYKQNHIFITGVYSKNTVESILKRHQKQHEIDSNQLEIDYYATNTVENVISTLRYLRKNNGLNKIMVISNDYHIVRIRHIINTIKTPQDTFSFYYYGTKTDFKKYRSIKILVKEVYKYLRTSVFLLLWGIE